MFVLGVATASPSIVVSSEEPREFSVGRSPLAARAGVREKCVSLPIEYIRETGNTDPVEGWKVATATPTSLGVQAVRDLLQQVGVSIEQVGLVLGDTGTPYQTCPSEAQRIAGEFGVKTAAFDLVGGIGAVPHMLSVVSRWGVQRTPDYALYVSTNTPSQHVHYKQDPVSAGLFGDAAVALLLGKQPRTGSRSARVAHAAFRPEDSRRTPIVFERSARINPEALLSPEQFNHFISTEVDRLERFDAKLISEGIFIAPQLYAADAEESLARSGVTLNRIVSGVDQVGFSLGSAHGVALSKVWMSLSRGQSVVMMHCGDGQCGSAVLVVE